MTVALLLYIKVAEVETAHHNQESKERLCLSTERKVEQEEYFHLL